MRDWLVAIRNGKDLSQYEVAAKAGISQSFYASIETEFRGAKLPVPTAKKIADALDFPWQRFYEDGKEDNT